ncbi:EcsC family protein [Cyclobacterium marinum]|uniref:EcsC protein n=1 Tax=Cyclobacterium marinum (strain ATCC 25205 / DSM 745 / LMG 13164 / NCIMB 1802) TaxID=880070 RepID=G0J3S1_CYCMS|nr:EcsC family protein [Cyclobacterium marinum]AEL25277.1 hypothetical protein Cycma_1515 [Cyclobacterium marinum DSM 745]|tara:strand:+ start:238 stop:1017 length:780 start_codon:yes stop_codon:yes gene_type:complete
MSINKEYIDQQYEAIAEKELQAWLEKQHQSPSILNRMTSGTQRSINKIIPDKIHQAVTYAIEKMVKGVLIGNQFIAPKPLQQGPLRMKEYKARKSIKTYTRTASVEGAITGAGGILMGFADLPAFLAIKMKMLFNIAAAFGHDTKGLRERLFVLYIFKLSFSTQKTRNETISILENWSSFSPTLPDNLDDFDWRQFQLEYRDFMDLAKLAQMIPVIGAGIGAIANFKLSQMLGKNAILAYRLRHLQELKTVSGNLPISK